MDDNQIEALCDKLAALIAASSKVMVFTGAGVSTESGIPDFRSPGGLWSRFDPDDFTIQKFMSSEASRRRQWQLMKEGHITEAQPNDAHYAVGELYKLGKLDCVVTQNIDFLHQKAGVPDDLVYQLHGNNKWVRCLSCGARYGYQEITARLHAGEEIPDCEKCHGLLKPEVVFFGEMLPVDVLEGANRRAQECDLCIVIGSTLIVYPAAQVPMIAVQSGARLAIVNLSETPLDSRADVLINASAGEAMMLTVSKLKARLGVD